MKGIMLKDLYDNFRVGKNLASYIFGGGFILIIALFFTADSSAKFGYSWITMMTAVIFSSCIIESSCEQDEKANFNRLLISFPMSKSQIVITRYLLTLCCIGTANLLTLMMNLYGVFIKHIFSLAGALELWTLGLIISIFFSGISQVCYYLLGKKIGTIVYMILFFFLAVSYNLFIFMAQIWPLSSVNRTLLLIAGIPVSILFLMLSCLISIQIFKRRYA